MIGAHIESILVTTGVLTAMALIMFFAPVPGLRGICGAAAPTDAIWLVIGGCLFSASEHLSSTRRIILLFVLPQWFSPRWKK